MRDYALGTTFDLKFTTRKFTTGAPFTLAGSPVVVAYVDNNTAEITAGITLSVDFDSRTGLNNVRVVASGGNGYASGANYSLVLSAGTVDGVSVVGEVVGEFSIEAQSALRPATAGRTLVVDAAGLADANAVKLGPSGSGSAQTARDLGASVLLSSGTGTGQLDFTSGVVKSNLAQILGTALTETAGQIAAAFKKFFDKATPTGTINSIPDAVAGASGGLLIAGTNAPVTITGSGDALTLTSTGANGSGLKATGNGGGNGIYGTGGATGNGASFWGGATFGIGLDLVGQTDSYALSATGFGSGGGVFISGGNGGGAAPGIRIDGGGASGNGIDIATTDGHAVALTATGASKHGLIVTGGTGGTSDGIKAVAGTGGVPIRGDLTGNITGNLSGSVASVSGNVGGNVTGSVGSVAGNVSGNVAGSVGSVAADGISAASLATDAVDEIQAGLASDQIDDLIQATASPPGLQFTAEALELAPTGTGGGGDCPTVEEIRIEMDANSSKLAAILTDTAEIGTAGAGLTNINLPNQTMDIVGNITGNVSGSVGSVAAAVDANVVAIDGSTDAVDRMQRALETEVLVTVDSGSTTTEIIADTIAPAGIDPDQFKGRVILFPLNTTTAALRGQGGVIEAYDEGTNTLTLESQLTAAPVAGDILIIV